MPVKPGPITPLIDTFDRANEAPITSWRAASTQTLQLASNQVGSSATAYGICYLPRVFWSDPDQEMWAEWSVVETSASIGLNLRWSSPLNAAGTRLNTGYECFFGSGASNQFAIGKWLNGTNTFNLAVQTRANPVAGDVYWARAIGSTLYLGVNAGPPSFVWTDPGTTASGPVIYGGGHPSFGIGNGAGTARLTNVGGGPIGATARRLKQRRALI